MARMVPEDPPPPGPGHRAETALFEALRTGLSDEFWCYRNVSYVEERDGHEGEADFLVLHREHGMLVIECKGFGVKCDGSGRWQREYRGELQPLKKPPFKQAQDHVKDLVKKLEARARRALPDQEPFPFVHGHAVAFPLTLADELNLPLDAPSDITFDASDLASIEQKVMSAYEMWRRCAPRGRKAPTARAFKRFRKSVLQPAVNLVPRLGARIVVDGEQLTRLTEEQMEVVQGWLDNERLRVRGGAGTGKTALALEAARHLAEEDGRVLLLCFNKSLGFELRRALEVHDIPSDRVQALTFHQLCARAYGSIGQSLEVPPDRDEARRFWEEETPVVLYEAIDAGALGPWRSIIVDEGQDFAPSWWEVIEASRAPEGRLVVFYDPGQNIFGREISVPEAPTLTLTQNFRNTKAIAEVVNRLGQLQMKPHRRCPQGTPPVVHSQQSAVKTRRALEELVRSLVRHEQVSPDAITILTPHSRKNSSLCDLEALADVPLAHDPADRRGQLLHATIGRFKGLESDVVILVDIDAADPRCSRNARYVAASRARQLLYVYARGDWMAEV